MRPALDTSSNTYLSNLPPLNVTILAVGSYEDFTPIYSASLYPSPDDILDNENTNFWPLFSFAKFLKSVTASLSSESVNKNIASIYPPNILLAASWSKSDTIGNLCYSKNSLIYSVVCALLPLKVFLPSSNVLNTTILKSSVNSSFLLWSEECVCAKETSS